MAAKKNFVLRIDEDVYKALEKWAADDFRSVNGQIEWLVDKALKETGRKKNKPVDGASDAGKKTEPKNE
ncbi:MAG: Arc family DNA binding domain-containing protein [Chitinophagaceae bacterium]|nr:Arc family DNA binding domain-containing protein [Chitinophagaceae bacterium]